jgi:hypothetical protein
LDDREGCTELNEGTGELFVTLEPAAEMGANKERSDEVDVLGWAANIANNPVLDGEGS